MQKAEYLVGNKVVVVLLGMKEKGNALLFFLKQKICHLQLMIDKKNRQALKGILLLDEMEQGRKPREKPEMKLLWMR